MLQDVLRDANDTSKPLDSVLRTAMVFAYSLGYQPLVDWVNAELDGYLPGSELPDYRSFRSEVHARFTDGYRLGPIQRISEYAFPEEWRDQVTRVQLRKGVRSLEDNSDRTDIVQNLPSYAVSYLKKDRFLSKLVPRCMARYSSRRSGTGHKRGSHPTNAILPDYPE